MPRVLQRSASQAPVGISLGSKTRKGTRSPLTIPAKYYISFGELIVARLDCNIGRATWNVSGSDLHFGDLARTHDVCSPGSMSERIAHDWLSISSYRILDGALLLMLKDGHGQYIFRGRSPEEARKPYGCGTAAICGRQPEGRQRGTHDDVRLAVHQLRLKRRRVWALAPSVRRSAEAELVWSDAADCDVAAGPCCSRV